MRRKITQTITIIILIIISSSFIFSTIENKESKKKELELNQNLSIHPPSTPIDISFCGEIIPIKQKNLKERLDREILVNTYWHSQTILFIKKANKYFSVIEPILETNGLPNDLKYLALAESGLSNIVSPSGATGFWQIMKATGKERGLEINPEVDERYHLEKSTNAASNYLLEAYERFKSWTLAAASYNMGMSGLEEQMEQQKVNNYYDLLLNTETARYIFRIAAIKEILENQNKYGFYLNDIDLYEPEKYIEVKLDSSVSNFADYSTELEINYKELKELNPWLRKSYLKNMNKNLYIIKVPKKTDRHSKRVINIMNSDSLKLNN
tara:strand:+ start:527 stop:1501 length:975 start_codon:yes stop_codon:yes gene_type:complete